MIARILASASFISLISTGVDAAEANASDAVRLAALDAPADVVTVTARRVSEDAQRVPIPLTVVGGEQLSDAGAFNVNRLKELVPTVQFFSSNPRNSAINIRGLGAPFGLTNDGIEPGAGLYVDGVFYARPALATLDFIDVEQIEILRGPQGTLYGKNTTSGAINITTRKPDFDFGADVEISSGNLGFLQAKGSITGPLIEDKLAGRLSFSGTQRDGVLYNVGTQDDLNDLNNLGVRGQFLFTPQSNLEFVLVGDYTRQRPEGYAQVFVDVAPTLRSPARQFEQIIADLNYTVPSRNPFDRITDADTSHRSNQDVGGVALTANWKLASGDLTSISAWRFWDWNPSNDRDFLGLPITTVSANPSKQRQWSQELRYAGGLLPNLDFVTGAFVFYQTIESTGNQSQGAAAARFLLNPSAPGANTPGLLDGLTQTSDIQSDFLSAALFTQFEWKLSDRLRIIPGVRLNYDEKDVDFERTVSGGLATADPVLLALQRSVLAPQAYKARNDDFNVSWNATLAWDPVDNVNFYATYATAFKSIGLNLSGVPNDTAGQPNLALATVKPEDVQHIEVGVKTRPLPGVTANLTFYNTEIEDYQANVVNSQIGVLRGFLANAEKVRVRGVEFDTNAQLSDNFSAYGALAYTDAEYVRFAEAPPPIEQTGGSPIFDASGTRLPGVSKWAASVGGEAKTPSRFLGAAGEFFLGADASYRSNFSSSASFSPFLIVDGYALVNARAGFRSDHNWDIFVWARNIADKDYFEFLSVASGGSGLIVGLPGDPRTWGVTMRASF
jgi:iron complex outermembrane receptor protein